MTEITITFDPKFTQNDLEYFINKHWNNSLKSESIVFDLSRTEWLSAEEITFLFAWIRKLNLKGVKIKVKLPSEYEIFSNDTKQIAERRRTINFYIFSIWGMYSELGLSDLDFDNKLDSHNKLYDLSQKYNFGKKILPFKIINTKYNSITDSVDKEFDKVISGNRIIDINSQNNQIGTFELEQQIISLLNENECYSPFENKTISNVITKELVINSMEHAKENESYFTVSLHDRWEEKKANTNYFKERFTNEKEKETLDFYKNKKAISLKIKQAFANSNSQKKDSFKNGAILKLDSYAGIKDFLNQSYLEFTFLDFGIGISATLKDEYINNKDNSNIKDSLSFTAQKSHVDSQILEYAFLMESSKDPFDREIPYFELIPRGLYFVIDMVRRYKGLLIARSGQGKVIYDFSNRIKLSIKDKNYIPFEERIYVAKDAVVQCNDENSFFPGTMISIVLPQRKSTNFKKSAVRIDNYKLNKLIFNRDDSENFPTKIFEPNFYDYFIWSLEFKIAEENTNAPLEDKNRINDVLFHNLTERLKKLSGKNCVLFIDFEHIPVRKNVLKTILFLSNSPMVNELTKVIILNLSDDEFRILKIYEQELVMNAGNIPFLFKPIPCINIGNTYNQKVNIEHIKWISVAKKEDAIILSKLFFGDIKKDSVNISAFEDRWICEGNVIAKHENRVYSIFTDFKDLIEKSRSAKTSKLQEYIKREIEDGSFYDGVKEDKKYLFQTTKGSYQQKYLSLYETLNYKYAARYYGQYLLDKHIENIISLYNQSENKTSNFEELDSANQNIILKSLSFNKMLVVTVSSQLLGVQIRNLIKENDSYIFLRNTDYHKKNNIYQKKYKTQISEGKLKSNLKAKTLDCPEIIKLSSYFSFDSEKPFKNVNEHDRILIVNDVISTGSLMKRIVNGINNKKALVNGILTIADSRKLEVDENTEYISHFFDSNIENLVISILSYDNDEEFDLKKWIEKPSGDFNIKRINPILNSVVSLKSEHTEKIKVLFEEPEDLINSNKDTITKLLPLEKDRKFLNTYSNPFNKNIFKIGHFKQGLSHNSYFTDMHNLFYDKEGYTLLKTMHSRISANPSSLQMSDFDTLKNNIINAKNSIDSIEIYKHLVSENDDFDNITTTLQTFITKIDSLKSTSQKHINYSPKFIFHPIYSGIEEVSDDIFNKIFGTDKENIISLSRYDTKNGWRFPFPAKRLNEITKGQHVLIIDSGALSGQSLVQLIDSISFLEVGRIDFLSIVGRIDDFQREFYSRLKSIKIKHLRRNDITDKKEVIINLNILFGINLHIPPYLSKDVCPYCKEIKILRSYQDIDNLPSETLNYIKNRVQEEIALTVDPSKSAYPDYLPTIRKSSPLLPDFNNIFLMRDKLGRIDSYRFYADYFEYFDKICKQIDSNEKKIFEHKETLKNFELILICLLHESRLFSVLNDLLVNVYRISRYIIYSIVIGKKSLNDLNYNWSKYSILRLLVLFERNNLYDINFVEKCFEYFAKDERSINYISYLLTRPYLNHSNLNLTNDSALLINELVFRINNSELYNKIYKEKSISNLLKNIMWFIEPVNNSTTIHQAFYNLGHFFETVYVEQHNKLLKQDISSLRFLIQNEDETQINLILADSKSILERFNKYIINNLHIIKQSDLFKSFPKNLKDEIFLENSVLYDIKDLDRRFEIINFHDNKKNDIFSLFQEFIKSIKNIQNSHLKKDKAFYNFATNYGFEIKQTIEKSIEDEELQKIIKERVNFNINTSKLFEKRLFGHQILMNYAFQEIFMNAAKRKENNNASIDIELIDLSNDKGTQLVIKQNTPWLKPESTKSNGGFEKLVKNVFVEFCGSENFIEEKTDKDYTIIITFSPKKITNYD